MNKFGIGNVSYTPICSSEEMKLEIKIPSANEVVKNMWDKLDDVEKGFINIMIDKNNKQEEEIERLNNKLKDIKSQLDYLETYSSKEDVFEDMKRRLDRINKIIGSDKE